MAVALAAAVSTDYETLEAAGLGLQKWFLAAALLSVWDYALLFIVLSIIFWYYILDFHIVGDILRGWKGDAVGLYFDPKSPVSARLVAKCEILKRRYWPTPWLCSPHLQTIFLHFCGRSPPVEYQRQLYITSDGGTIALDWVKLFTFSEDGSGESRQKNAGSDETPTAIIVPGLTSDSSNHYVKYIARSLSDKGWRVVVANHRGLGGVSITSDQFYNAGWTEDLRKIILLVQQTYPKSPLLAVGTSIGANILVKYLGEEGPRTPLGGAVAISCPWDLLLCDRFMSRMGVQSVYNKALTTGLLQYAKLHETALARIVDWDFLRKAASIRDFDNNCTRHVGKYERIYRVSCKTLALCFTDMPPVKRKYIKRMHDLELQCRSCFGDLWQFGKTVDTYYRRCSSTQFVESIAVPLLCISAKDDPICTKEAIPYDECRKNPNVILGVAGHGGHLAFFEGLSGTSLWWVRAATEFAKVLLSSSFMHQQSNVVDAPTNSGSNIDKGPFLTMNEGLEVAQDSGYGREVLTVARENQDQPSMPNTEASQTENGFTIDEGPSSIRDESILFGPTLSVNREESIVGAEDYGGPLYRSSGTGGNASAIENGTGTGLVSTDTQLDGHPSVTLQLRSSSEVAALRSALSQLLDQIPLPSSIVEEAPRNESRSRSNRRHTTALCQSSSIEIPITESVVAGIGNCVEATKDLLGSENNHRAKRIPAVLSANAGLQILPSPQIKEESSGHVNLKRDLAGLTSQNRRTLWLLTYVALVTSFPVLGSALFVRTRGKLLDVLRSRWPKRTG